MNELKAKPCPFCSGEAEYMPQIINGINLSLSEGLVRCKSCFATTPNILMYEQAIAAWNRRADDWVNDNWICDEWINVEERLPDKDGNYLCYSTEGFISIYEFGDIRSKILSEGVTHWNPLPEPPKGE